MPNDLIIRNLGLGGYSDTCRIHENVVNAATMETTNMMVILCSSLITLLVATQLNPVDHPHFAQHIKVPVDGTEADPRKPPANQLV
jgi:hypothetical protein